MGLPIYICQMVGCFLETLNYGIYLVVLPQCFNILRRRRTSENSESMNYLLLTMLASFIAITFHLVIDLTRNFEASSAFMKGGSDTPEDYYANANTWMNIAKVGSYAVVSLMSDLVLIYRTFIVWGRNRWIIVLPSLLWLLDFGISIWFGNSLRGAKPGHTILDSVAFNVSRYFFLIIFALNALCTFLIAFKIWHIGRIVRKHAGSQHRPYNALSIVLESAAIYSIVLGCLIGLSFAGTGATFWFFDSTPPLVGYVFAYVILRTSTDTKRFDTGIRSTVAASPLAETRRRTTTGEGVHIHLERMVHHDRNSPEPHLDINNDGKRFQQKDSAQYV